MERIYALNGLRRDLSDAKKWLMKTPNYLNCMEGRAIYAYAVQLKEKINEIEQSFGTISTPFGNYEEGVKHFSE